ncbi:MAG: ATP-binding protein [Minicystis sp.]
MDEGDAVPENPAQAAVWACGPITVLDGRECVRKRPGMYIGDALDGSGLHNLAWEVIENAVEEHLAGRCLRMAVTIHRGGALTVEDEGPGISLVPVGPPERQTPGLEEIMTRLGCSPPRWQARWGGGLHSVGLAAVNALCEILVVEVRRGGRTHRQSYRRGLAEGPIACVGPALGTGTRFTLHPDPEIFASTVFDGGKVAELLRKVAFLNPGFRIDFADERRGGRRETFLTRGIGEWVERLTEGQSAIGGEPIRLREVRDGVEIDIALAWTRTRGTRVLGFANQHETRGAHVVGLLRGLAQAVKRTMRQTPGGDTDLRARNQRWDPAQLMRGLTAIVDVRGSGLKLGGCCRDILEGPAVRATVQGFVAEKMGELLAARPSLLFELGALATSR